jgi:hypothetical protein
MALHDGCVPDGLGFCPSLVGSQLESRLGSRTRLTHPDGYCLRSNQIDSDEQRLWRTDIMVTEVEAVFRSLKARCHRPRLSGHRRTGARS